MMNVVRAILAAASKNLEFIKDCEIHLPKRHRIARLRLDSAGYQSDIFNYLEVTGKSFAIGGRLDASALKTIEAIPGCSETSDIKITNLAKSLSLRS